MDDIVARLAGLGDFEVRPNDLIVAVSGTEEACELALQVADDLLMAKVRAAGQEEARAHSSINKYPDGDRSGPGT